MNRIHSVSLLRYVYMMSSIRPGKIRSCKCVFVCVEDAEKSFSVYGRIVTVLLPAFCMDRMDSSSWKEQCKARFSPAFEWNWN
ncbi:hypothetical protein BRADI_5g24686v3 [Brachypodium distachyon]|uniref:Uncharacterized protein n=1 Tax=Brachypodium distachyon TaxID=15368 RepID=A0A2K2CJ42_BRADI|nr:hypothetical protein BRADI_5g24686v3 [Brachypodium distachyon]